MSTIFTGGAWSIQRFVSGFSNNAFLITCTRTGKSVIVDTPASPDELISAAAATKVEAILITHGHQDHVEGLEAVIGEFPVPVGIGVADRESLPGPVKKSPGLLDITNGSSIEVGDISLRPVATPGHTPGSTCFMLGSQPGPGTGAESESPGPKNTTSHVFTGDTLFPGGPGRSASPQALAQMLDSIRSHIFTLSGPTVVLPGHGDFTTVGESVREHAVFASKPLDADLSGDVTWA